MIKLISFFLVLFISNISIAATSTSGEIKRIYAQGERVNFRLKDNQSCNPNNKYYYFTLDSEVKKTWYSLILAAANTSKRVVVSIEDCPSAASIEVKYIYQDF